MKHAQKKEWKRPTESKIKITTNSFIGRKTFFIHLLDSMSNLPHNVAIKLRNNAHSTELVLIVCQHTSPNFNAVKWSPFTQYKKSLIPKQTRRKSRLTLQDEKKNIKIKVGLFLSVNLPICRTHSALWASNINIGDFFFFASVEYRSKSFRDFLISSTFFLNHITNPMWLFHSI